MLDILSNWVDEIPPIEQPQRFGNISFRTWLNKVKEEVIIRSKNKFGYLLTLELNSCFENSELFFSSFYFLFSFFVIIVFK
jgi:serine/threonine-protein phosphatase 2A activator